MKLVLGKGWDIAEEQVSDNPTEHLIEEVVNSLDWQNFNSITLVKNNVNWLSVSGNISNDGLAIVIEEDGTSNVSERPPETIDELIKILQAYLQGDEQFKITYFDSITRSQLEKKLKENELRKVVYESQRTINRRNNIVAVAASIVIVSIFSIILYFWYHYKL
ncbi:MAG: hypothetical protein AAF992_03040 [Bacteroidota bacterium]